MMRLADQPPLTCVLGGVAAAGVAVLATAFVPSVLFPPHAEAPGAPKFSVPIAPLDAGLGMYRIVFEKPLFNPLRAKDPAATVQAGAAPAVPALSEFRLVGVVTSKDTGFALVEQRSTKQVVTLHPGDSFAGRRVEAIAESGVDLAGPSGAERLTVPKAEPRQTQPQRSLPKLTHP
jgi:hypothetical protein